MEDKDIIKEEKVDIDEGGDIAGAEAPPEASTGMSEEQVRKICEEVIGAFLDKFTPEAPQKEVEEVEEVEEDLEY